jgi:hypothetical protein
MIRREIRAQQFRFEDQGITFTDRYAKEIHFSFLEPVKLRYLPYRQTIRFSGEKGYAVLALPEAERSSLVLEFFRRWKKVQPDLAKKAAFDYVDGQKGFVSLAFFLSVFFTLPLSIGFLADSKSQFYCTEVLRQAAVLDQMQVVKFKKKRKGHYILDLELKTPGGFVIQGKDQLITKDETQIPKQVPVLYAPENPSCWSLTPDLKGTEINWAKRRYFGTFTLLFGSFFLYVTLYGFLWSSPRLFGRKPLKKEIADEFGF